MIIDDTNEIAFLLGTHPKTLLIVYLCKYPMDIENASLTNQVYSHEAFVGNSSWAIAANLCIY